MDDKPFRVGDSVIVKAGGTDPDSGGDISGWQGRIAAVHTDTATQQVEIEWDSITLKNMPESVITDCEEQGLDWSMMGLAADEVAHTKARDSERDVARVKAAFQQRFGWLSLGDEQGKRIQQIVNQARSRKEMDVFRAWHKHLESNLHFPFQALASEPQRGPVRQGDTVKVLDISMLDETYGTIVAVKHTRGLYELPLCDLDVTDQSSANFDLVDDYSVWFANR